MNSTQQGDKQDENHDALIISVITTFSALSFVALILRLAARRIKRIPLYVDDYLAIVSWVRFLPLNLTQR